MQLTRNTKKNIRTAVGAWRQSWNRTPQLVLFTRITKILSCIVVSLIAWYFICSYGYDTVSCARQNDFLLKTSLEITKLTLDNLCSHNYENYLVVNIVFSSQALFIIFLFLNTIFYIASVWRYYRGYFDHHSILYFYIAIMSMFFASILGGFFIIEIVLGISASYDIAACYTNTDLLNKIGNYTIEHRSAILTMEDLCRGTYPEYVPIAFLFFILIILEVVMILIILGIAALLLWCLYELYSGIKYHLKNTRDTYDRDIAKMV